MSGNQINVRASLIQIQTKNPVVIESGPYAPLPGWQPVNVTKPEGQVINVQPKAKPKRFRKKKKGNANIQNPGQTKVPKAKVVNDKLINIPLTGVWKPVVAVETPTPKVPDKVEEVQVTPTRKEKWLQFQASLLKEKVENKVGQVRRNLTNIDTCSKDINKTQTMEESIPESQDGGSRKQAKTVSQQSTQHMKFTIIPDNFNKQNNHPTIFRHGSGVPKTFVKPDSLGCFGAIQPQTNALPGIMAENSQQNIYSNTTPGYAPPRQSRFDVGPNQMFEFNNQRFDTNLSVQTNAEIPFETEQQYSPSDVYDEIGTLELDEEDLAETSDISGQKRVSAFDRLGPLTQPKKPKLTINLLCNKDVRKVVDEAEEDLKYAPVHTREDIISSTDEIVRKYLAFWPWKKHVGISKTARARKSKSAMLLEQEQMEECYDKEHVFFLLTVTGYPSSWQKEQVIDVVLEHVRGKSFIPTFIEFTQETCKFFVVRSRPALLAIHKLGFYMRKGDIELAVSISLSHLTINHFEFIPRLVLRKVLANGYDGERKLNLSNFTTKPDLSNFIYFPLNRHTNQIELIQIQSTVAWDYLTDLDLSHNRISTIDGFEFPKHTPRLKHLDLSYNWLEKVTILLRCRELGLHSIKLEGNPLCHDYTDPAHYVRVVKMIFPSLMEIDGLPIPLRGDLPSSRRNYCPDAAKALVERFLELYFPLLDSPAEERLRIESMYDSEAVLTVTYKHKLRQSHLYRYYRNLFLRARSFDEGEMESVEGALAIAKLLSKWPEMQHDPHTFTVDVMNHSDTSTILRVFGILKLTAATLADDEHLLAFTRTLVLHTKNGVEYKILNEMVYWDSPTGECANAAFKINQVKTTRTNLKLDITPNDELKESLIKVFMDITELDKDSSERCLDTKEWNLKCALEHFMKLVKLDDVQSLGMTS